MEDRSLKDGFWDDQKSARKVLKEKKSLEDKLSAYESLKAEADELPELIDIAEELEDEAEAKAVADSFDKLSDELEDLRTRMLLSGKYDDNNAILSIHAGTGGVDANDWAEMLERMYQKRLKGYASLGYTVGSGEREAHDLIYDADQFRHPLLSDIEHARQSVVISSPYVSTRGIREWMSVLLAAVRRGIRVEIRTKELTAYKKKRGVSRQGAQ